MLLVGPSACKKAFSGQRGQQIQGFTPGRVLAVGIAKVLLWPMLRYVEIHWPVVHTVSFVDDLSMQAAAETQLAVSVWEDSGSFVHEWFVQAWFPCSAHKCKVLSNRICVQRCVMRTFGAK
eukprot:814639-Amphidinium_carterae.2